MIWLYYNILREREREREKGKESNTRSVLLGGWFFKPKIFTRLDSSPTEIHTRIFGTVEKILLCFPRNLFPSFLLFCTHSKAGWFGLFCFEIWIFLLCFVWIHHLFPLLSLEGMCVQGLRCPAEWCLIWDFGVSYSWETIVRYGFHVARAEG